MVQHCANRTGSTISGLLAAEGFRREGWDVDVAFGFEGPMIAEYAALGCGTHVVPHKNWLRGGNVLQSARRMAAELRAATGFQRLIDEVRPDVVYINSLVSLAAGVAARRTRIPCVWHLRELFSDVGGEMQVPAFGGRRLVRRTVNRLSRRRVAISRSVATNVLGTDDPAEVTIVPNAVDSSFFEVEDSPAACREHLGLGADSLIVGVPGTLRPMKGHGFFLDAAARVSRAAPDCVFAITGTGEAAYAAELRARAARLGLDGRVRFLGTIAEMARFYRACDVICVPSLAEPFGRTVIEAFAVGAPIVATSVGGIRETIEDGVTGLLVKPGDVAGLSESLLRLLGDEELRLQLADAGRSAAAERYCERLYHERINGVAVEAAAAGEARIGAGGAVR